MKLFCFLKIDHSVSLMTSSHILIVYNGTVIGLMVAHSCKFKFVTNSGNDFLIFDDIGNFLEFFQCSTLTLCAIVYQ